MLFPLHPILASNLLTIKFALNVRCDPQFCSIPGAINLVGEVFSELG